MVCLMFKREVFKYRVRYELSCINNVINKSYISFFLWFEIFFYLMYILVRIINELVNKFLEFRGYVILFLGKEVN